MEKYSPEMYYNLITYSFGFDKHDFLNITCEKYFPRI